jgi:hypothetical protein
MGWKDVADKLDGLASVKHAVLTYQGSWSAPGTGYASQVIGALQNVNPDLCYEVPSDEPSTFGILSAPNITAPSYAQSGVIAYNWTKAWLQQNPFQTFALAGYSQGGEDAAMCAMALMPGGDLEEFADRFIGGYTFGNPRRGLGFHAPTIADPGKYHGISPINMTALPYAVNGSVVWSPTPIPGAVQLWADYVHSPANGDAGLDMYAAVPVGQVGVDMTDVYNIATQQQLNDPIAFATSMSTDLVTVVKDSGVLPSLSGGLGGLLTLGGTALIEFLIGLLDKNLDVTTATGPNAAVLAAVQGLNFVSAPGGPTMPHTSYYGESPGYSDMVDQAVGFLGQICALTPARSA